MPARTAERGVTLVETMIAILVAFIALSAIGGVVFSALISSKNQGVETTRMTAIANEKINELFRLSYSDTSTNTTLISASTWNVGLTNGGGTGYSSTPCAGSDNGYVDFLDASGNSLSGTTCSAAIASGYTFERRWQIAAVDDSSGNPISGLKQITVIVYDTGVVNTNVANSKTAATPPYVTLTTLKSQ